jgi:hypothetical protein
MLAETKILGRSWNTTNYLDNRSSTAAAKDMTPEEAWAGGKVDMSHLPVFSCGSFVHVSEKQMRKWYLESEEHFLLGYCENTKGYRLANSKNPFKIVKDRDVVSMETASCNINNSDPEKHIECAIDVEEGTRVQGEQNMRKIKIHLPPENVEVKQTKLNDEQQPEEDRDQEIPMKCRYPERQRQPKKLFDGIIAYTCGVLNDPVWRITID